MDVVIIIIVMGGEIMRMDEKAVSPVIGVILMVAITVILAAVIASFVFGMAGSVKRTYTVAATAEKVCRPDGNCSISVVYHGGPDHQLVSGTYVTIANNTGQLITLTTNNCTGNFNDSSQQPSIGATCVAEYNSTYAPYTVTVGARFRDGTEQVILRTSIS